ncbi:MAG: hypothetical protein M3301_00010 [Chloroflexota bacterium]|nr:hypothetical protein [Chloroflexota bacterium]
MSTQSLRRRGRIGWSFLAVGVIGFTLSLVAIKLTERQGSEDAVNLPSPVNVEQLEGSDLSLVTLTPRAAERAGLRTARVRSERTRATVARQRRIVPYSAVLYDDGGAAWVYTSRGGLTFARAPVTIASIEDDVAILSAGPPEGALVAAVGAAELYGAEFEVDH